MGLGPHRLYRRRVLAVLRTLPDRHGGIDLCALGRHVHEGYADADVPWLARVVASLAKDGLAVAEERPASGAGGNAGVAVRLP